jgi:hypothetical protein
MYFFSISCVGENDDFSLFTLFFDFTPLCIFDGKKARFCIRSLRQKFVSLPLKKTDKHL